MERLKNLPEGRGTNYAGRMALIESTIDKLRKEIDAGETELIVNRSSAKVFQAAEHEDLPPTTLGAFEMGKGLKLNMSKVPSHKNEDDRFQELFRLSEYKDNPFGRPFREEIRVFTFTTDFDEKLFPSYLDTRRETSSEPKRKIDPNGFCRITTTLRFAGDRLYAVRYVARLQYDAGDKSLNAEADRVRTALFENLRKEMKPRSEPFFDSVDLQFEENIQALEQTREEALKKPSMRLFASAIFRVEGGGLGPQVCFNEATRKNGVEALFERGNWVVDFYVPPWEALWKNKAGETMVGTQSVRITHYWVPFIEKYGPKYVEAKRAALEVAK